MDTTKFNNQVAGTYEISYTILETGEGDSFQVTVLERKIEEMTGATVVSFKGTYHKWVKGRVEVTKPINASDATVMYRHKNHNGTNFGDWTEVEPIYKEVCNVDVEVKFSKDGFKDLILTGNIVIEEGTLNIASKDVEVEYDGALHSIDIKDFPENSVVKYKLNKGDLDYLLSDLPEFQDAGKHYIGFMIEVDNYQTFYGEAYVVIKYKEDLTGISADDILEIISEEAISIEVKGTQDNDVIEYRLSEKEEWKALNPVLDEAGEYNVYYRVLRGNSMYKGSAKVTLIPNTQLDGITAMDCAINWSNNGFPAQITVNGTKASDIVIYSLDKVEWSTTNPTYYVPTNGEITVFYKVLRKGSGYFSGSASVLIRKANYQNPINTSYTLTVNYKEGLKLSDISLTSYGPVRWVNPETELTQIGAKYYDVYYNAEPDYYNDYLATERFKVEVKALVSQEGVIANNVEVVYDGKYHTIDVVSVPEGFTILYSSNGIDYTEKIKFKDAMEGSKTIYYKATRPYYEDIKGFNTLTIKKASYENIVYNDKNEMEIAWYKGLSIHKTPLTGDFKWLTTDYDLNVGEGTYQISYNLDKTNYNDFIIDLHVIVKAIDIEGISADNFTFAYQDYNYFPINITGKENGDVSSYRLNENDDWETGIYGNPTVGVYTIYYKISRTNHNDYFGSYTVTVNKREAGFVVEDVNAQYDGNAISLTVSASDVDGSYIHPNYYSITYSLTADGAYQEEMPECVLPGTYDVYVKLDSKLYDFKDQAVKAKIVIEKGSSRDFPIDSIPDMNYPEYDILYLKDGKVYYYYYTFYPDLTNLYTVLSDAAITEYNIYYSYDEENWVSNISFSTPCEETTVYYKVASDLYEDIVGWFFVQINNQNNLPNVLGTYTDGANEIIVLPISKESEVMSVSVNGKKYYDKDTLKFDYTAEKFTLYATNEDYLNNNELLTLQFSDDGTTQKIAYNGNELIKIN